MNHVETDATDFDALSRRLDAILDTARDLNSASGDLVASVSDFADYLTARLAPIPKESE